MEREVGVDTLKKVSNMGADSYSSASSRLLTLQNRKQLLEDSIAQKNQELRELCIQEAQLTSIMPSEVPLEPNDTLPNYRRKVGTAFEYPPNLISKLNSEKESIVALETEIQFQRCILEDASRLVNDSATLKEKRKNTLICEQAKHSIKDLEERLEFLKIQRYGTQPVVSNNQLKQKKKPRPPFKYDKYDVSSLKNNNFGSHGEDMNKAYLVHHNYQYQNDHVTELEQERYMTNRNHHITHQNVNYEGPQIIQQNHNRQEYGMSYTLDRLPTNAYSGVKDRRGSGCSSNSSYTPQNTYSNSHPNINTYQPQYSHTLPLNSHIMTNVSQINPHNVQYHNQIGMSQPNLNYSVSPHNVHTSPLRTRNMENDPRKNLPEILNNGFIQDPYLYAQQYIHTAHTSPQFIHTTPHNVHTSPHNIHNSPHNVYASTHTVHGSPHTVHGSPHTIHASPHDKMYVTESDNYSNSVNMNSGTMNHPEPDVLSTGLGGYWVKTENNESVWVTISPLNTPVHWPRDKRFGSLDRRKDKFVHNKHVNTVESRKNTNVLPNPQPEIVHTAILPNPSQIVRSTSSNDCKPLVRTQSLGSVGAQTVDISWPDDNSSCDSDAQSLKERNHMYSRRTKPKGWCETSLDGPPIPENLMINTNLIEEPIYTPPSRISFPSPQTPKLLEIPAESNPSPIHPEPNNEIFNNNGLMDLPKNCTVVQAGQFKPYREVTKPFEMEDFYKYSTKFREKKTSLNEGSEMLRNQEYDTMKDNGMKNKGMQQSYDSQNDSDVPSMVQKSIYQPLQPMKCQPFGPPK